MDNKNIVPRSPREEMNHWIYLPRFIDKIRLSLVGKLPLDYQENFLKKGFDAMWLDASGVKAEDFINVVKNALTDGEVCDWVRKNVKKSAAEKEAFKARVLNHGKQPEKQELLAQRKREANLSMRDDIQCFVDFIDADEGRI